MENVSEWLNDPDTDLTMLNGIFDEEIEFEMNPIIFRKRPDGLTVESFRCLLIKCIKQLDKYFEDLAKLYEPFYEYGFFHWTLLGIKDYSRYLILSHMYPICPYFSTSFVKTKFLIEDNIIDQMMEVDFLDQLKNKNPEYLLHVFEQLIGLYDEMTMEQKIVFHQFLKILLYQYRKYKIAIEMLLLIPNDLIDVIQYELELIINQCHPRNFLIHGRINNLAIAKFILNKFPEYENELKIAIIMNASPDVIDEIFDNYSLDTINDLAQSLL